MKLRKPINEYFILIVATLTHKMTAILLKCALTIECIKSKIRFFYKYKRTTIIKMATTVEEQILVMEKFKQIAGFENVMGAIDCTHIRIQAESGDDAQLYVNRKGYFSLNVQAVCDASLKITDIVACWKGSAHDSRIFNESKIKERFEKNEFLGRLIGDGGYKCTNYLFTPIQNPKDSKEDMFNKVHIKTRNVVERLFGVWKSRFRILLEKMRMSRRNCKILIVALAVLHNLSIMYKEQDFYDTEEPFYTEKENHQTYQNDVENENISRALYIQQHF
ncbi:putative nuclease HARBI1 [Lucilia cuprina]|nr:putative nuclease HARBI1 [Lucilia cuprina]